MLCAQLSVHSVAPQDPNRPHAIGFGCADIDGAVTNHRGARCHFLLLDQAGQLLPFLNANIATADKLEMVVQAKHRQYAFSKIAALGGANTHRDLTFGKRIQGLWYSGVQRVFCVAHIGIALPVFGHQLRHMGAASAARDLPERNVQRRADVARDISFVYARIATMGQGIVD